MTASIPPKNIPPSSIRWAQKPILVVWIGLASLLILGLVARSIYVAIHEPDPQETVILGQTKIASGNPLGFRIVVRNRASGNGIGDARVELTLLAQNHKQWYLGVFKTDATGTLADPVNVPELPPGEYQMVIDATSRFGHDRVTRKVEIHHPIRLLLSSDKPVYQPGQTIHLRSLLLNSRTEKPFGNERVTFEVSDPKGNKVFKQSQRTSQYGIASADFLLASELNIGRYELRVLAGATSVERTVEVKRYVLPKFRIQVEAGKPYYLPGETVSGSVEARYFFGRAVAGASVYLLAETIHEKPVALKELHGKTDSAGRYLFEFALPDFLPGMPQKGGQAFLDLTAEVRDTGGHAERKTLSLSVAQNELDIVVVPEAGAPVPGVENIFYVLTAYPDGRPAPCQISVDGAKYQCDAQGVSEFKMVPGDSTQQIEIEATDPEGRKGTLTYRGEANIAAPAFLMRTDKAIYEAGRAASITILSPEKQNTIFIDVIKDGQTVLTKTIPLNGYKAAYTLNLPASLVGTLKVNAYVITSDGTDRGCSRTVFVSPASGLRIAATPSRQVFRPGEMARLDFTVTDAAGNPAPAALGIAAVDESVFSLHESRPGLLQQFLDAEKDLLKPRYQVKFFDSPASMLEIGNQSLACAYFASLEAQRSGLTLDELVSNDYIPVSILNRLRNMRSTPELEKYRSDPEYAAVMRLLQGASEIYSIREATGAVKTQRVEAYRKAYFRKLWTYARVGFLGMLFLLPIALLVYYSRPGAGVNPGMIARTNAARYAEVAGSLYSLLAVLILLPLICYPVGFFALERSEIREPGWVLLGFETLVVLLTFSLQHRRFSSSAAGGLKDEVAPLRVFQAAFLIQFLVSRAGFVFMTSQPQGIGEGFAILWFLATIIAPLVVLGSLSSHVRRRLASYGITEKFAQITFVEVLVVVSIIFILAAMLLPSLARAKSRAMSVSLRNDLKQIELAHRLAEEDGLKPGTSVSALTRVRRDFPETLLWQPQLITDERGKASLDIPLADSITTWRASIEAISAVGKMGSLVMPIAVFQDFFVDLDLPVVMSLGDQVSVPVTCYNYLKDPQNVRLEFAPGEWFESPSSNLSVRLGPGEVKSASFSVKVLRVGNHNLRVTAHGPKLADAIEREINVVPTGERNEFTRNETLREQFGETFAVPANAIPDSQSLWVKFYPSRFSEVVEGLDSIFQAPYGCFEQTSSTTYPNVLVLDYMTRMGRITPEVEIKARKFINAGYQRLLTFEVTGGGFEWFGHAPANICLTAYGVLEFTDMARVHPVDEAVIERARKWLFTQQQNDGSWTEKHRGWTWSGRGTMTAFVAWALAESGNQSDHLEKALAYLRSHPEELSNTYSKALAANAFLARNRNDSFGRKLVDEFKATAIRDGKGGIHWTSSGYSITYSHDSGMSTECTALCVMALIKARTSPQLVKEALTWISTRKFANGTHGSTQATILAMRALLGASTTPLGQEFETSVAILLNGKLTEEFRVNKENSDVMKQIELTRFLQPGENRIEFRQDPGGELPFQLTGVYWLPAPMRPIPAALSPEPLQIAVAYDRTSLTVTDRLRCNVTVQNNTTRVINMAIVDLGIPPGFAVDTAGFETMQQKGQIARFEVTGNQAILYLRELPNKAPFRFSYSLQAQYPLRVQTPRSAVYEYYQPQNRSESTSVMLQALAN